MPIEVDNIHTDLYQNLKLKEVAGVVNQLQEQIVVSDQSPDNNDGRPDGTIYFEVV